MASRTIEGLRSRRSSEALRKEFNGSTASHLKKTKSIEDVEKRCRFFWGTCGTNVAQQADFYIQNEMISTKLIGLKFSESH